MLRILGSNALVLFFVCLASGGCATRSPEVAPPETKAEAVAHQQGVIATAATDEDAQVDLLDHQLRLASMAIDAGDTELARNTLVEYTDTLSSIYGEETFQSRADKAISKFTAEEEKYFIGDPYEQMMAYLYLGMLDFQAGDIAMARASFRSASRADEGVLKEGYKADSYLAFLLEGVASRLLGEEVVARDAFQFAERAYSFRQRLPLIAEAMYLGLGDLRPENAKQQELEVLDALFPLVFSNVPGALWQNQDPEAALREAFMLARYTVNQPLDDMDKHSDEAEFVKSFRGSDKQQQAQELLTRFEEASLANISPERTEQAKANEEQFHLCVLQCQDPATNAFVLVEQGQGPAKVRRGRYGEVIQFYNYPEPTRRMLVSVIPDDGAASTVLAHFMLPGEAIDFQARTRGGREMDSILKGKAQFRDRMSATSSIAGGVASAALVAASAAAATMVTTTATTVTYGMTASGTVTASTTTTTTTAPAGMAAATPFLIGAAAAIVIYKGAQMIADAAHPEGDIRGWHELPNRIFFVAAKLPEGAYSANLECFDGLARPLDNSSQQHFEIHAGQPAMVLCTVPWK